MPITSITVYKLLKLGKNRMVKHFVALVGYTESVYETQITRECTMSCLAEFTFKRKIWSHNYLAMFLRDNSFVWQHYLWILFADACLFSKIIDFCKETLSVADLRGGVRDARPPLCVQILSISCSFWENLAKLRVHAPPLEGSRPPPWGNPRSVTDYYMY